MLRGFEFISQYQKYRLELPQRKTLYSAGYDLAAAETTVVPPQEVRLVPTGLKAYMQSDEYLGIHIRSSLAVKNCLLLANGQGIIDADYYNNPQNEGHILVALYNFGSHGVVINAGDRIAQGIFYHYLKADHDALEKNTERLGGFGSTGR